VAVGLGSNLGDRAARVAEGVRGLAGVLRDLRCSAVYETEPEGPVAQGPFLNMCCVGRTEMGPAELLGVLLELERASGRLREGPRYGPRSLDLDLLLYGSRVVDEPGLRVPHPRLGERAFVLVPLAGILPDWRHPGSGASVAELAARTDRSGVRPYLGTVPDLPCRRADPPEEREREDTGRGVREA